MRGVGGDSTVGLEELPLLLFPLWDECPFSPLLFPLLFLLLFPLSGTRPFSLPLFLLLAPLSLLLLFSLRRCSCCRPPRRSPKC